MESAKVISKILIELDPYICEGANLLDVEDMAWKLIKKYNAKSFNKGYHPSWAKTAYPSVICIGVNDDVCHTPPKDYVIKSGDMVSVDLGIRYKGKCGDAGFTKGINPDRKDQEHLRIAKEACYIGIAEVKAGGRVAAVGVAIDKFLRKKGYVCQKFSSGHGIGKEMHEPPQIPMSFLPNFNYGVFEEGQVVCIEPFITKHDSEGKLLEDGWSVKTKDGRKCAFFEHMVQVTANGGKILTTHFKR